MSLLFSQKIYSAGISGVTTVYTDPSLNTLIAQAEKFFVQVRGSQTSGTTTITVSLQSSCDGVDWNTKGSALVNAASLGAGAVTYAYGTDAGSTPGGSQMRLKIDLAGTSPSSYVDIWLTGRSNN